MATVGTAEVEIEISKAKVRREADAAGREIEKSLGDSSRKAAKELEDKLSNIRIGAGVGVATATALGLGYATKAASDLNETTSKSAAVFGEAQAAVLAYAESADQGIGLSKRAALDATSTFGNLFTQLGVGKTQAADLSTSMVTLAADFGSFFNEDPVAIIEAQTAAFRGEYDALQKYVPTINAAAVEQQALTETGKANAAQLTQQEKALATYTLMMEGAGAAQGDFGRTSDSAANAAKRAKAEIDNNAASLGQALLPVAAAAAEVVGALAGAFGELPGPVQTGIVGVGGMTLATALLLPKLVEGGQLLKLAGSKAAAYAQDLLVPTQATEGLGQANVRTSSTFGKFAGGLAVAAAGLLAYNETYGALEAKYASGLDTEGLADDLALLGTGMSDGQRIVEAFGGSYEEMAGKVTALTDAFDNSGWENLTKGSNTAYGNVNKLKNEFADLDQVLATLAKSDPSAAAEAYRQLAFNLTEQGVAVEDIVAVFPNYLDQVDRSAEANGGAAGATGAHAAEQKNLADEAKAAADALRENVDAATAVFEAQRGVTAAEEDYVGAVQAVDDARRGVADAEAEVADAQRGVAEAQRAVRDAQEGVADALDAVADARRGVADAERELTDAQVAAADAVDAIRVATEDLAVARREATGDSDEYRTAMQGVYDAEVDLAQAQEDSLTAQQNLDQARKDYSQTLAGLQRDAEGAADGVIGAEIRLRDAQESLATLGDAQRDRVSEAQARLAGLDATASVEQRTAAEKALAAAIAALPDADDRARAELAVRDAQRGVAEATERAAEAAEEAARVEAAGVEGSDAVVAAREGVTSATEAEVTAQGNLEAAVQNVADVQTTAIGNVVTAQDNLATAIAARADADQRVVDAKQGVVDAHDRVRDAAVGVRDAQQRVSDATNGVADAQQRVIDARQGVVDAQGAVSKAIDGVTSSVLLLAGAQFEAGTKTGITKDEIDKQIIRLGSLRDTLDPANPLRRQLDGYIAALQATNGNFTAVIALNFTDAAGAVVENGQAIVAAALGPKSVSGPKAVPQAAKAPQAQVFWPDQSGSVVPPPAPMSTEPTGKAAGVVFTGDNHFTEEMDVDRFARKMSFALAGAG